jgi:hypothetical protein
MISLPARGTLDKGSNLYASATTLYKKALTIQGFFVSERFPPFAQALLVSVVANRST